MSDNLYIAFGRNLTILEIRAKIYPHQQFSGLVLQIQEKDLSLAFVASLFQRLLECLEDGVDIASRFVDGSQTHMTDSEVSCLDLGVQASSYYNASLEHPWYNIRWLQTLRGVDRCHAVCGSIAVECDLGLISSISNSSWRL